MSEADRRFFVRFDMKSIEVKTGFGYITDGLGHVLHKMQVKPGKHDIPETDFYLEVDTQAELDVVKIWQDPVDIEHETNERKIAAKVRETARETAIEALKAEGELPPEYK